MLQELVIGVDHFCRFDTPRSLDSDAAFIELFQTGQNRARQKRWLLGGIGGFHFSSVIAQLINLLNRSGHSYANRVQRNIVTEWSSCYHGALSL